MYAAAHGGVDGAPHRHGGHGRGIHTAGGQRLHGAPETFLDCLLEFVLIYCGKTSAKFNKVLNVLKKEIQKVDSFQ